MGDAQCEMGKAKGTTIKTATTVSHENGQPWRTIEKSHKEAQKEKKKQEKQEKKRKKKEK